MEDRFRSNLERVRNIVVLYESTAGVKQGRPTVLEGDLLRVGVVFLHATLEDLFRDVLAQRLPLASAESLKRIPWPRPNAASTERLDLGYLAAFRGQSVGDAINHAIQAYLEKSNFNHPSQLRQALQLAGLDATVVDVHAAELSVLMIRRHWIVHRCDRNDIPGRGQHSVRSISKSSISGWIGVVERFGEAILSQVKST